MTVDDWLCPSAYAASKGADPITYWKFDECGGPTAYDYSGNGNNGTLNAGAGGTNTAVGQMWTRQGKIGGALECDGTDDYVNCGTFSQIVGASGVTGEAWIYPTTTSPTYQEVFVKGTNDILMRVDSGGNLVVTVNNVALSTGAGKISVNNWQHIAYTWDTTNDQAKIYINGLLTTTGTILATTVANTGNLYIGEWSGGGEYFNGLIDDVRIYNYARTADQILVDYNAGAAAHLGAGVDPNEGNPPAGYWTFDEGTGTTAYDRSGGARDLTLNNMANSDWVQAKNGGALDFTRGGSQEYLTGSALVINTNLSLEAWIKPRSFPASDMYTIILGNGAYYLSLSANKALACYWYGTTPEGYHETNAGTIPLNTWSHVASVWDGTNVNLYINGVKSKTVGVTGVGTNAVGLTVGAESAARQFDGLIDDVKIYNYARSAGQVAYDYSKGAPIAHYKFDEGGGTVAHNEYSLPSIAPHRYWRFIQTGILVIHAPRTCELRWTDLLGNARTPDSYTHGGTFSYNEELWNTSFDNQTNTTDSGWITGDTGYITADFGASGCAMMKFEAYGSYTGSARGATWDIQYSDDNSNWVTVKTWNFQTTDNGGGLGAGNYAGWYGTTWHTHCTLVGDTKFVDGKIGKALTFDGSGDYVTVNVDSWIRKVDYVTITGWYYHNADSNPAPWGIMTTTGGGTGDGFWWHVKYPGNAFYLRTEDNVNGESDGTGTPFVSSGNWYHIATVVGTNTFKVYKDGELYWSWTPNNGFSWANINSDPAYLLIGRSYYDDTSSINGKIDDVRLYNYERTAEQIRQDYNAGVATRLGTQSAGVADPWGGTLPVGHWKLDENTGVLAQDASGNGSNGTLGGGTAAYQPTWTHGKFGPCLTFDGNDDRVDCGTNSSLSFGTGNFSVSLWMKATGTDTYNAVFDKGAPMNASSPGYQLFLSNGYLRYNISDGGGINWTELVVGSSPDMRDNTWHHVVWVYSGSSNKFYLDGRLLDTDTWTYGSGNPTASFLIGKSWVNSFRGSLDEVRIYNYARTQAQIAWDYNQGKPVGHWRFNEGSGTTAYDESGNGYNASFVSVPTWVTGKYGSGLQFDNIDDGVSIDNKNFAGYTDYSMSAWVKPLGNHKNYTGTILSSGDWNNVHWAFGISQNNSGIDLRKPDGSSASYFTVSYTFTTGAWYHVSITRNNTTFKTYVNGVEVNSRAIGSNSLESNASNTTIGRETYAGGYFDFNGVIDDVRIYNYARTAEQIQQDYLNGAAARLGD